MLSLALVVLVVGAVTTAGLHNLSSSNAATGSKTSGSSDTTAPAVSFTAPGASSVTGSIPVTVTASDEPGGSGMATVSISLDGNTTPLKQFTGSGPYSFTWDTRSVANGSHTLTAVATDKAGNNSTSLLTVTVY